MSEDDLKHHARLRALCEGALELAQPERAAWLERICGDDPVLHDEVVDLLRRVEEGGVLSGRWPPFEEPPGES